MRRNAVFDPDAHDAVSSLPPQRGEGKGGHAAFFAASP